MAGILFIEFIEDPVLLTAVELFFLTYTLDLVLLLLA